MAAELERLAYEAALRGLDKQERLLEELRTRTGVLLAASSLAASFLGQQAFKDPRPRTLALTAILAFTSLIAASVFILLPNRNLVFAAAGPALYEGLYELREDMPEVYRRLTYNLDRLEVERQGHPPDGSRTHLRGSGAGTGDRFLGRAAGRYHPLTMTKGFPPQTNGGEKPPPPPPPIPGLGLPETLGGKG